MSDILFIFVTCGGVPAQQRRALRDADNRRPTERRLNDNIPNNYSIPLYIYLTYELFTI